MSVFHFIPAYATNKIIHNKSVFAHAVKLCLQLCRWNSSTGLKNCADVVPDNVLTVFNSANGAHVRALLSHVFRELRVIDV